MYRLSLLLVCVALLTLVVNRGPRAEQPLRGEHTGGATVEPHILGVASCAAMACHHGNGPRGSRGSEYSSWIAVDPHAKAYQVLFNPESQRMHELLTRDNPALKGTRAHENPRCLACHAMGAGVEERLQGDGVGCERCHGAASTWKDTHYVRPFARDTAGFKDLRNKLSVRAEVCTECHVGKAGQEVDHDLIAAGHPRLRFEYAAYFASYPKHWRDEDRPLFGQDVEARSLLVGQLTTAKAALELLAARAGQDREAWPEFAEYDCSACHHTLSDDKARQARKRTGRPGDLLWGSWYYSMLPTLPGDAKGKDLLEQVRLDMGHRFPPRKAVEANANAAAAKLATWLAEVETTRFTSAQVRAWMKDVAQRESLANEWDTATQMYLSLAALHQALGELDREWPKPSPLQEPLKQIRKGLLEAFPKGSRPVYDSPKKYDAERVREALKLFR